MPFILNAILLVWGFLNYSIVPSSLRSDVLEEMRAEIIHPFSGNNFHFIVKLDAGCIKKCNGDFRLCTIAVQNIQHAILFSLERYKCVKKC